MVIGDPPNGVMEWWSDGIKTNAERPTSNIEHRIGADASGVMTRGRNQGETI